MWIVFFVYLTMEFTCTSGFFFGSSSCQCCQTSSCPVQTCLSTHGPCPEYPSPIVYVGHQSQDCCSSCVRPCKARQILHRRRQKRQDELQELPDESFFIGFKDSDTNSNLKCNSERLRKIILMGTGIETSVTKRNIQLLAEKQFHHKYNVICTSQGDFSYITSTDEYCQEKVDDKTFQNAQFV